MSPEFKEHPEQGSPFLPTDRNTLSLVSLKLLYWVFMPGFLQEGDFRGGFSKKPLLEASPVSIAANARQLQDRPDLTKAEPIGISGNVSLSRRGKKKTAAERGVRICARNTSADTKDIAQDNRIISLRHIDQQLKKNFEIQLKSAESKVSSKSKFEKHIEILSIPTITFQVKWPKLKGCNFQENDPLKKRDGDEPSDSRMFRKCLVQWE
ncbi:hypothetical protein HGM15179_010614 [Zosterops borbonicus]|uniref:Uncharacterized protein n=1 Tax=Zosterops borbonicus TaxID=364589 RepID=A0A8K1GD28_9PASS|nr:hypothetical protein HGM15179_010614 [Zosterops borbonicus]